MFSDAYVNGLRATFLRSGNSGVVPFHSICGDAPEIEQKTGPADLGESAKTNQDAALAIGKGAAMQELLNLPLTELERRCRHNGLSLVGGREMMVARLLYLEEAEKLRVYEIDDELKHSHGHSTSARARREISKETDSTGLSGWNSYEDDMHLKGKGSVPLVPTEPVIHELVSYSGEGKNDQILPASKWAREDDESDDEHKRNTKDLGLTYSSSGSEHSADGFIQTKDADFITDVSHSSHPESGMNEEQRYNILYLTLLNIYALSF